MRDSAPALPGVRVCRLTHEFVWRFQQRLGREADLDLVNRLLAEAKRIRKQQTLYKLINGVYCRYQALGEFWHHGAGLIMVVNEHDAVAVTVFTPADEFPRYPKPPRKR